MTIAPVLVKVVQSIGRTAVMQDSTDTIERTHTNLLNS